MFFGILSLPLFFQVEKYCGILLHDGILEFFLLKKNRVYKYLCHGLSFCDSKEKRSLRLGCMPSPALSPWRSGLIRKSSRFAYRNASMTYMPESLECQAHDRIH